MLHQRLHVRRWYVSDSVIPNFSLSSVTNTYSGYTIHPSLSSTTLPVICQPVLLFFDAGMSSNRHRPSNYPYASPIAGGGGGPDYSGYMSEGGASVYARRMQQRFREGMQLVQECLDSSGGSSTGGAGRGSSNRKFVDVDDDRCVKVSSLSRCFIHACKIYRCEPGRHRSYLLSFAVIFSTL